MFHANGWTYVWIVTAAGGTHVLLRRPDPAAIFDHIRRERITHLCAAPTVLISMANAPTEVRRDAPRGLHVTTAGAPPAPATLERVEEELGWHVSHLYGLTETSPFMTVSERRPEHAALSRADRSAMLARQGVEQLTAGDVRVLDEHGRDVPHDGRSIGEIVVRGNVVMAGYYKDPEATARAFEGGYFHSGDAAVVHPDGYLEIQDRFKDIIISGGENISSIEVEGTLLRHPCILEAAVVGVPHDKWGEAPHAFVVLRPGMTATAGEIVEHTRAHLAHFKAPKGVTFVAELPKTATGKVQKFVLRGGRAGIARQ
jgi:fatty-acyl-CoA synthase